MGIASSSFILFFYLLYWYSYIVYFVCAPASEFGAMDSTPFLGFSYPNLLIVFLNLLFFRNLYHIFLAASVGTLSGSFFILFLFSVPYFGLARRARYISLPPQPMIYRQIFARKSCRKNKIFVQDFVPIRTALRGGDSLFLFIFFFFTCCIGIIPI